MLINDVMLAADPYAGVADLTGSIAGDSARALAAALLMGRETAVPQLAPQQLDLVSQRVEPVHARTGAAFGVAQRDPRERPQPFSAASAEEAELAAAVGAAEHAVQAAVLGARAAAELAATAAAPVPTEVKQESA